MLQYVLYIVTMYVCLNFPSRKMHLILKVSADRKHQAFNITLLCFCLRAGLGGPGIESRWGAKFSAPVQTGPVAHPVSYTMGTGSFPGVKRPGLCYDLPPPMKRRG